MTKNRIEAFSDGVLAIIITIMILEIRIPEDNSIESLKHLITMLLSYVLSFIYIGIYWNSHHHLFQAVTKISGKVMWANTHLLFWLSLVPFGTSWIGNQEFASIPMAVYGFILLMSAIAYNILQLQLVKLQGDNSILKFAIKEDKKEKISLVCYFIAIPFSFISTWISGLLYIVVALIWIVPDKRIEKRIRLKDKFKRIQ